MITNLILKWPGVRRRIAAAKAREERLLINESLAERSLQVERLQAELAAVKAARNRTWLRSPVELKAEDLKHAFDVENTSPLWRAVHQVLDQEIQTAVDDASAEPSAANTADVRLHRLGGIDYLRKFQKELLDRQEAAQKLDEDLAPEKEKL